MQDDSVAVSVVLSTYNRASLLRIALEKLIAQTGSTPYEIIIVDNNSTDGTAALGQEYVNAYPQSVRYLFEPRQGLSYGRNAGIAASRGDIIALSDDDVEVAPDWIGSLVRAFDRYPDADYIGGRILPRWPGPRPRWLNSAQWSPLALQDYGDTPFRTSVEWPVCLVGGNLAFRRVFDRIGLFDPAFGRVKDGIGSTEDHELQLRAWQAGLEGVYVPDVVATAPIAADRMKRAYHTRWHHGHGRHCARMRLRELIPEEWTPMGRPANLVRLFGAPTFVYAELVKTAGRWLEAVARRRDAVFYGNRLRHLASYIAESRRMDRAERRASTLEEVMRFSNEYRRKVWRRLAQ